MAHPLYFRIVFRCNLAERLPFAENRIPELDDVWHLYCHCHLLLEDFALVVASAFVFVGAAGG